MLYTEIQYKERPIRGKYMKKEWGIEKMFSAEWRTSEWRTSEWQTGEWQAGEWGAHGSTFSSHSYKYWQTCHLYN